MAKIQVGGTTKNPGSCPSEDMPMRETTNSEMKMPGSKPKMMTPERKMAKEHMAKRHSGKMA